MRALTPRVTQADGPRSYSETSFIALQSASRFAGSQRHIGRDDDDATRRIALDDANRG
jgi:hypothetical protein